MAVKKKYLLGISVMVVILILFGITYNTSRVITERTVESHQQSIATETCQKPLNCG